jgi:hypothetical protein
MLDSILHDIYSEKVDASLAYFPVSDAPGMRAVREWQLRNSKYRLMIPMRDIAAVDIGEQDDNFDYVVRELKSGFVEYYRPNDKNCAIEPFDSGMNVAFHSSIGDSYYADGMQYFISGNGRIEVAVAEHPALSSRRLTVDVISSKLGRKIFEVNEMDGNPMHFIIPIDGVSQSSNGGGWLMQAH